MKKILLVIFLTISSFSFAEDKIVEYYMCDEGTAESLYKCVDRAISVGWQPYGSPFGTTRDTQSSRHLYQALVKTR